MGLGSYLGSQVAGGARNAASWLSDPYIQNQANMYGNQMQKSVYSALGPQAMQGVQGYTNALAGLGPLADSGARNALASRMASNLYGQGQQVMGTQVPDFLRQLLMARYGFNTQNALMGQQFNYQKQLADYQRPGLGDYLGSSLGAIGGAVIPHL